ncbi:DUF5684 domain-containing protein [Microbacterium amylolyticum]|uniref:Signal peptidase I n=1 Tax=Microbacterium amylolyticum TaxID=936337 RepID=A0ABS4ZHY0_9MICO|nr:DUF5684 domain-containing protein [Microbacterium amylolyticum]MBP2436590.1 hypothetical protein [Microbacterium amylolyticum]
MDSITDMAGLGALYGAGGVVGVICYIIVAIALWKVFTKAGLPGFLAIIPIVNLFALVKVSGLKIWWGLLYLVPIVNIVFAIIVALKVGERFGKGGAFSFFLLFLFQFIGYLILGFGDARYRQP